MISALMRTVLVALLVAPLLAVAPVPRAAAQDGGTLGDPPVFTSDSLVVDASESIFTADIPSVNLSSRSASVAYFNSYYRGQAAPAINWTGSQSSCNPGTTSAAFKDDVLLRIMYFRGMAGVPTTIALSATASAKNQQAALLMSRNASLTHFPPTTWACWTQDGYDAASSSNIALGYYGRAAVDAYIKDGGSNNAAAGHRRWLLYPQTKSFGTGDVPPGSGYNSSNAIWVFDSNIGGPRPATRDGFVAWPPPGYVPYQVVYPRWTFSYPGANFASANVTLTQNGANVPVTVESRTSNGYGENTIVFRPTSMDHNSTWPNPGSDTTYRVTITGVGNAASSTFTYDVIVINPDGPGGGAPSATPTRTPTTGAGAFAPGMMVRTTTSLNLRSGPGTSNTSLAILPGGTRGAITGPPISSGGFTWYPVAMEVFPAGWVAGQYLQPLNITATPASGPSATATRTPTRTPTASSTRTTTPTRTPTAIAGSIPSGSTVETTANLRLRSGPSGSANTLLVLPNGARGTVTGSPTAADGYLWYPATFTGYGSGYVAGSYLRVVSGAASPTPTRTPTRTPTAGSGQPGGTAIRTTANLNLRVATSTSATVRAVLPNGAEGTITGSPVFANGYQWYPVSFPGYGTGWVVSNYIQEIGSSAEPTETTTAGGFPIGSTVRAIYNVNVRSGSGTQYSIISVMPSGRQATVLSGPVSSTGYQWYRLQISGIGTGWVAGEYLQQVSVSAAPAPEGPSSSEPISSPTNVPATSTATVAPEPTQTPTPVPPTPTAPAVEEVLEPTATMVIEEPPPPTATSTVDAGPQPLQVVRIQRTDGSTGGEVLVDRDPATVWYAPGTQVAVFVADVGAEQWISDIRWQTGAAGLSGQLYLSISSDGLEWTDLDLENVIVEGDWSTLQLNAPTLFVRFAFINLDDSEQLGGIAEVELWP